MWGSRTNGDGEQVDCLACGSELSRSDAREYDKYGDRWDRNGKTFEYLCKACHTELCHQPRDELEDLLCTIDAGSLDQTEFLAQYDAGVVERYGPLEEREQ